MTDAPIWRCARCDVVQPFVVGQRCPWCGCWWLSLDGTWKHTGGPTWPDKTEEAVP